MTVLVLIACFLSGLLAGATIDRFVVQFPAWRHLGVSAWAAYSRRADLGNGLFLYPVLAIGHTLLMIAAVVVLRRNDPRLALDVADIAAALAIVGLLVTVRAAPIMMSLKHSGDDPGVLERAFRGFMRWSVARAVAQVLAFVATLVLLVRVGA